MGRQDKADLGVLHNFTSKVKRKQVELAQQCNNLPPSSLLLLQVIKERKKEALEQKSSVAVENNNQKGDTFTLSRRRLAFLDMLVEQHLKDPEALSELDIREEVDTFMFEVGNEATCPWQLLNFMNSSFLGP